MREIRTQKVDIRERDMSTAADPRGYVTRMIELESSGKHGDQINAIDRVAYSLRLGPKGVRRIMTGERKTYHPGLIERIREKYLETCERVVARIQNEIEIEKRKHHGVNDDLEHLGADTAALLDKIQQAKRKAE